MLLVVSFARNQKHGCVEDKQLVRTQEGIGGEQAVVKSIKYMK